MPGFLLHQGATVICTHAGTALPTAVNLQVTVGGLPTIVLSNPYAIAGCALSATSTPPCTVGQWVTGATRVFSGGQPLVILSSQGVCPPGQLQILSTQTLVSAT